MSLRTKGHIQPSHTAAEWQEERVWLAAFRGVRARLFESYVALELVLLLGLSAAFSSTQVLSVNFTRTVNTVDALATAVAATNVLLARQEASVRGYLLTGDTVFLQQYAAVSRALPALTRR